MFLYEDSYLIQLKAQLARARHASVAVAFWGRGAESIFEGWRGESLRIICNFASGGTNPRAIKTLRKLAKAEIRQLDDLHAKMIVTDCAVIVGSANVSANGLGLEGTEVAGWRETGILIDSPDLVKDAQAWFERQWHESRHISKEDMDAACISWQSRRKKRPGVSNGQSLLRQPNNALKDRAIYLAIYRQEASNQALDVFSARASKLLPDYEVKNIDFFEDWQSNPPLPQEPDAVLIEVYFSPRGKVDVKGILAPLPGVQLKFKDGKGESGILDLMVKLKKVGEWTLTLQDRSELASELKPWLDSLVLPDNADRCIPFYEFRLWQEQQGRRTAKAR